VLCFDTEPPGPSRLRYLHTLGHVALNTASGPSSSHRNGIDPFCSAKAEMQPALVAREGSTTCAVRSCGVGAVVSSQLVGEDRRGRIPNASRRQPWKDKQILYTYRCTTRQLSAFLLVGALGQLLVLRLTLFQVSKFSIPG
jgi:hypothetical protein